MTKLKKSFLVILVAIAMLFSCMAIVAINYNNVAYADATNGSVYYTAEQYTDSDYLLLEDGTLSKTTSIKDFSDEVKSASVGTSFPELAQVIPRQYLETSETNDEFYYNGKEYGFYVAKEGSYFDVLLIDFVYEFEDGENHSDIEYKIRIKLLLQQTFIRSTSGGNYVWRKAANNNYTYYVANPRFLAVVRNENAWNYGDLGYSKSEDEGAIIFQTRINYGAIEYKTESDAWETCLQFYGDKLLSAASDIAVEFLDQYTAGLASIFKDLAELSGELYENGKATIDEYNNENNIFTEMPKGSQEQSKQGGYSRVALFKPTSEIILSDDEQSYAECITVLSDSNERMRLNQYCEFDIYKRSSAYDSMTNVLGDEVCAFSKERVLFLNNTKGLTIETPQLVYTLPNGTDSFEFNAQYASDYRIFLSDFDSDSEVFVNGKNFNLQNSIYVGSNETILIDVSIEEKSKGTISILPNDGTMTATIHGNEAYIVYGTWTGVKTLKTNNSNLEIIALNCVSSDKLSGYTQFGTIKADNQITYPFVQQENLSEGKKIYYAVIHNTSSNSCDLNNFTVEDVDSISAETTNYIDLQADNLNFFEFSVPVETEYKIILSGLEDNFHSVMVLSGDLSQKNVISYSSNFHVVHLEADCIYFLGVKIDGELLSIPTTIQKMEKNYQWRISGGEFGNTGKIISQDSVLVKRGVAYSLSFLIDNLDSGLMISYSAPSTNLWMPYSYLCNNNVITFSKDCPLGGDGIEVRAISSFSEDLSFNRKLSLIPTDELELDFQFTNTDELVTLVVFPRFVYSIDYQLIAPDGTKISRTLNIAKSQAKYSNSCEIDLLDYVESITNTAYVTFKVNKITYIDAIGHSNEVSYSYTTTINILFGDGSGTNGDPYTLEYERHLNNIRKSPSSYFVLKNDIVCYGDWVAISEFNGILSGNGNTITYKHLNVPYGEHFGFISINNGNLLNIRFKPTITVNAKSSSEASVIYFGVGGAVGINYGTLNRIFIEKTITSPYMDLSGTHSIDLYSHNEPTLRMGGVCGLNYGEINSCFNYASLGGSCGLGGIVGNNYPEAELYGCTNYGSIYFNHAGNVSVCIGGIAANIADKSVFSYCCNFGTITWAAKLNSSVMTKPYIARLAAQICETVADTGNYAGGSVVVINEVQMLIQNDQLDYVKDDKYALVFKPAGSDESNDGCVAEGTLITLADGSQVPVESLTGNEMLLVWNMYTGSYDVAPILCIDSDPIGHYELIKLSFSDGTTVDVISEHGFFDVDLNKYVYLDEYAADYIGHCFLKQGESGMTAVTLVDVEVSTEVTVAYSPVTYGHLCYFVNGMLSMPGGIDGLFNIFEVDPDTMMYDTEAMAADIQEYGLFTYEELNALVPVPEEMFEAVNGQYLKVAMSKGLITLDQIQDMVDNYSDLFEV